MIVLRAFRPKTHRVQVQDVITLEETHGFDIEDDHVLAALQLSIYLLVRNSENIPAEECVLFLLLTNNTRCGGGWVGRRGRSRVESVRETKDNCDREQTQLGQTAFTTSSELWTRHRCFSPFCSLKMMPTCGLMNSNWFRCTGGRSISRVE